MASATTTDRKPTTRAIVQRAAATIATLALALVAAPTTSVVSSAPASGIDSQVVTTTPSPDCILCGLVGL